MSEGFYFMHRGWQADADFEDDPFSRRDAWAWLIEHAAHKDTQIDIKGHQCKLAAGQMMHSVRYLAEQWLWGKSTVQRFLKQIENSGKIKLSQRLELGQVSGTVSGTLIGTPYAVITICNYAKYQRVSEKAGTPSGTVSGTGSWDNNNNNKDLDNTKTISKTSRSSHEIFLDIVHLAGMNGIPKDEHFLQQWLDLGAYVEDEINPVVNSIRDRLLQQTGKAPFTLKVFDAEIRQRVHERKRSDEIRKMANNRAEREKAESEEYHRQQQAKLKRSDELWEEYWTQHPEKRGIRSIQ